MSSQEVKQKTYFMPHPTYLCTVTWTCNPVYYRCPWLPRFAVVSCDFFCAWTDLILYISVRPLQAERFTNIFPSHACHLLLCAFVTRILTDLQYGRVLCSFYHPFCTQTLWSLPKSW